MANNNWNNYTEKTATPVDADEVMVRDSTDGKNKKLLFGTFWKWVAKKLNEATISELQTSNKTIVGALNQLNSDCLSVRRAKIQKSETISAVCLNSLVLIISTNGGMYDLYACIGYQSDAIRSKIQLLSGNGNHKITYSSDDSAESVAGIYTITNGSASNYANVYIIALRK